MPKYSKLYQGFSHLSRVARRLLIQPQEAVMNALIPSAFGADSCEESKQFFFEKKNQKTFVHWASAFGWRGSQYPKAFCFFFSKKKVFLAGLNRSASRALGIRPFGRIPAGIMVVAAVLAAGAARACDGRSYTFNMAVGDNVSGGGLVVRLDRAKFIDGDRPDKYYISVKDDGTVLADHMLLKQHDSISLKTRCGTLSIGADRQSMFNSRTLGVHWSYF